ncbi:leguminosin group486 secreted peptide, partial [Trifolium medium]|nr:leguminosin group486 secreted peptide [Trifolium medium]
MLVKCYVALFLALVFVQFYVSIDAKHQEIKITFSSLMPSDAKPVYFDCGDRGKFVVATLKDHVILVPVNNVLICHASWDLKKATFTAFDPK